MYIQPGRPAFTGPRGGLVIIQSTGAVTTATHGYEEEHQLFVYIPRQLHVSYILKRIEVFFFSSLLSIIMIYPLSKKIYLYVMLPHPW